MKQALRIVARNEQGERAFSRPSQGGHSGQPIVRLPRNRSKISEHKQEKIKAHTIFIFRFLVASCHASLSL